MQGMCWVVFLVGADRPGCVGQAWEVSKGTKIQPPKAIVHGLPFVRWLGVGAYNPGTSDSKHKALSSPHRVD